MHVRLEHRYLDDFDVLSGSGLFEEFLQECPRRRVDHRHSIECRPCEMYEQLMR